jgi:hypothetical protein
MMQKSGEGVLAVQGSPKCISIASRERWLEIFVPSSWSDIGPRLIREVAGGIWLKRKLVQIDLAENEGWIRTAPR